MGAVLKSSMDDAAETSQGILGKIEELEQGEIYLAETVVLEGVSKSAEYYRQIAAYIRGYQAVFTADALHIQRIGEAFDAVDRQEKEQRRWAGQDIN